MTTKSMTLDDALETIRTQARSERDKGTAFERLCRIALMTHPGEFGSLRFERIIPWGEWEGSAGSPDTGIDLVGYQHGGGLAAIQCKFYAEGHAVKKGDIDGFIAASNKSEFTARILINTGDAFSPHAAKLMNEVVPHVELVLLEDMRQWPVADWSGCLDDDGALVWDHEPYEPFPHQDDAITDVLEGFETHDRGKMILPCGAGKSVTAMWIAERHVGVGGSVLYLVPSIALMGQTMREWAANRGMPHRYVGVCSDKRSGRTSEDQTLAELTMPVTTDADAIAAQLEPVDGSLSVVFATYQSLRRVAEAQHMVNDASFDLVVCDEAHRTTGVDKTNDSAFMLIHDNEQVSATKRLYMTATPRVYSDKVRDQAAGRDFGVYSMNDETIYGPKFHQLTFAAAVEEGLLSDYQVVAIAVDSSVLPSASGDKGFSGTDLTHDDAVKFAGLLDALADPETGGVSRSGHRATGTVNHLAGAKRAIAFSNTIKQSQQIEEHLPMVADRLFAQADPETRRKELIDLTVRHIDGKSDALKRAQSIQWLRDGATGDTGCLMLTNARCLTEGVDVPALDAIVFCSPRKSQIDVVQAVGRVMRRAEGKEVGYVVLPVVVEDGQSAVDALDKSCFNDVWSVLRALRSHDERLDVIVNSADLATAGDLPIKVLDETEKGRQARDDIHESGGTDAAVMEQLSLLDIALYDRIASVLVGKVGDRQHWKRWGTRTAKIAATVEADIEKMRRQNSLKNVWVEFAADIRAELGQVDGADPAPSDGELAQMLAQHAITLPVFEALFADSEFVDKNPMCLALSDVLDKFESHGLDMNEHCGPLVGFYQSVSDRLTGADTSEARLSVLLEVYESFLAAAMPDTVNKLGIVYTPVELVDFVLRSADAVTRQEFNKGLTDPDVHILDPFAGAGTFTNRLITGLRSDGGPLIEDEDLPRKFSGEGDDTPPELHANELVLIAYYLAAIKIEEGYASRRPEARYRSFQGIVWGDTFLNSEDRVNRRLKGMRRNNRRAQRQNDQDITVIAANPPWSAGQKSSGDDNPRSTYPHIEQRIRDTYGKRHRKVTGKGVGKAAGNLYVQAIRWASDRLPRNKRGVIAFIHPNSLSDAPSLAGARAALRDEFTDIYVVNLLGDAMKSGDERASEGQVIFGIEIREKSEVRKGTGSRNGVQITVLVRNPHKDQNEPAELHYAQVPEYSSLQQKFEWLEQVGDITSGALETIPVNDAHDWVNITDGSFNDLLPVCSSDVERDGGDTAVKVHFPGLTTACDAYVYSFSRSDLIDKMQCLIETYRDAYELYHDLNLPFEECTANTDLTAIKWTETLKQSLKKGDEITFDETRIREVLYRPFTKLWLYEDHRILSRGKAASAMFPRESRGGGGGGGWGGDASSSTSPSNSRSGSSPRTASSTSAPQGDKPDASRDGGHRDLGNVEHDLSSLSDYDNARPGDDRGIETIPNCASDAIMMAGPSNMAIFGVLAAKYLPDLHMVGPGQQTRTIPRKRS